MNQSTTHVLFRLSLFCKAAFAAVEILAGIGAYFVTQEFMVELIERVTGEESLEQPHDLIANYLFNSVQHFSVSARNFTAVYLLSHGVVKLWLIVGLLREKHSYYPLAIAVFSVFIVYQVYRFSLTHSLWLVLITVVDVVVIALTWQEYRFLRRSAASPRSA